MIFDIRKISDSSRKYLGLDKNNPKIPTLEEYLNRHCVEVDAQGEKLWIEEYNRLYGQEKG